MKIAVQLFGHLRSYEEYAKVLYERLLSKYDCDVFIHTWDVLDFRSNTIIDNEKYLDIISVYKPKGIVIEKQQKFDTTQKYYLYNDIPPENYYSVPVGSQRNMIYSMYTVNHIRKEYCKNENVDYDYILFIRPDIYLHEDFEIEHYLDVFKYNSNSIISFCYSPIAVVEKGRVDINFRANDLFFITKPDTANKLFSVSVFDKFEKAYIEYNSLFGKYNINPEISFHQLISLSMISHEYYFLNYSLLRLDGSKIVIASEQLEDGYHWIITNEKLKIRRIKLKYKKILFLCILIYIITLFIMLSFMV